MRCDVICIVIICGRLAYFNSSMKYERGRSWSIRAHQMRWHMSYTGRELREGAEEIHRRTQTGWKNYEKRAFAKQQENNICGSWVWRAAWLWSEERIWSQAYITFRSSRPLCGKRSESNSYANGREKKINNHTMWVCEYRLEQQLKSLLAENETNEKKN